MEEMTLVTVDNDLGRSGLLWHRAYDDDSDDNRYNLDSAIRRVILELTACERRTMKGWRTWVGVRHQGHLQGLEIEATEGTLATRRYRALETVSGVTSTPTTYAMLGV